MRYASEVECFVVVVGEDGGLFLLSQSREIDTSGRQASSGHKRGMGLCRER